MSCRAIREFCLDLELGAGDETRRRRIAEHLERCAACRARVGAEADAVALLASLRDAPPPAVDVTARVMAAISARSAADADRPRPAQLAWSALVAATVALVIAGRLLASAPALARELAGREGLASAGTTVGGALLEPALAIGRVLGRVGLAAFEAAAPLLGGAIVTAFAIALTGAATVIARDLLFGPLPATGRREESP